MENKDVKKKTTPHKDQYEGVKKESVKIVLTHKNGNKQIINL